MKAFLDDIFTPGESLRAIPRVLPSSPWLPETVYAKDQPEYFPLPACNVQYADGTITVITRYRFTWRERLLALFGRSIWLEQMTFGRALQPQRLTLREPLRDLPVFKPGNIGEPLVGHDASTDDLDALMCGGTVAAPETATNEIMFMPGGTNKITPSQGGKAITVEVLVDRGSAAALETQRQALVARGKRPFFDFNHEDREASFWPTEFFWKDGPQPGVYARGEWTRSGRDGVEGKDWRQFSPVFHVDSIRNKPAKIVCNERAKPNMGGLVNDPAFQQISPLWAKTAAGAENPSPQDPTNPTIMTSLEYTALENKNKDLQKELDALKDEQKAIKARNESDALVSAQLSAKEKEIETNRLTLELDKILATNKKQGEAIKARNEVDAKAEVKLAVDRGAIAAKDQTTQDFLVLKATEDPSFLPVIKAMQGNAALGSRITPSATALAAREGGEVRVGREGVATVLKGYGAILARNAALPLSAITADDKNRLALEAAEIFAGDLEGGKALLGMMLDDAIKAADFSDPANNVGLLSGTLVLQSTLSKMQYEYPQIYSVFTDFSAAPGLFRQTEVTRIVLTPAVQTYNETADASGRPSGWSTVSPAQTVDVPITLDEYVGIPIVFGQTTLASTTRNLFGEVSNQALYALGGYLVRKLMALFTPANYNAYAATSAAGGATTSGSPTITVTSTAGMYPGQLISGTGIAANSFVKTVNSGTTATLNYAATATGSSLTFVLGSGKVPTTYSTYAKALSSFSMASLADIKAAFDTNEVPQSDRSVMLNAQYYAKLSQDPNFNTFFAAMRSPEIITKGMLPELQGFTPMNAPFFPTDAYRTGFAYHKSAAALKSRLPADFSQVLGIPLPGSVTTITDPATGLSLLLVQRVSLNGGYAEWMPTIMLGAAVGERRAGLVLTSQ